MAMSTVFGRLLLVVLSTLLPSACRASNNVITIEGAAELRRLDLSPHNKMAIVELLKKGDQPNPAFDSIALKLRDEAVTFARIDVSHPENHPWIDAAAEFTFAAKILPPRTETPTWVQFRNMPQEGDAVVHTLLEAYRKYAMLPRIESSMSAISPGVDKGFDKNEGSTTDTTEEHKPELASSVVVKGNVGIRKSLIWVTRLATMSGGTLTLQPIVDKTIITTEVVSLDDKTVVEGCEYEKDGGCFSIYNKRKKAVLQLSVSDPREAEAWVRYAKWQQHAQMSSGQPSSPSHTRASDAYVIEIKPTLLKPVGSKRSVDCVADVNPDDEAMKLLKRKAGDKITCRTLDTDNTIAGGQEYIQETFAVFGSSVGTASTFPGHTVTLSPGVMYHLDLEHGSTITLRGNRRDRLQEVLVVSGDDSELSSSVGINERLREALGVRKGELVTLVQEKAYPRSPPLAGNMWQEKIDRTTMKHSCGNSRDSVSIASDSLYPGCPPLVLGGHLSSACSLDKGVFGMVGIDKSVDSSRVCLFPTEKGSVRITRGDEPMRNQKPLWEAGGRASRSARWLGGFFGVGRKSSTSGGNKKNDEQDVPVEDVAVCVRNGRMVVGRLGKAANVVNVTYRSPRPRGWWKVYLARFSRTGRNIKDAGLKVSPNGRVTVETADGAILWEVDLPAAGGKDVRLMA